MIRVVSMNFHFARGKDSSLVIGFLQIRMHLVNFEEVCLSIVLLCAYISLHSIYQSGIRS